MPCLKRGGMMKVNSAELIISAVGEDQYPTDGLPEFALVGRSNVGKSSLINTLIQRKALARTSSQPGKTQTMNFYRINDLFYFVDLPGYGYAKVSKRDRERWGRMIEHYLTTRQNLRSVLLLVDFRHPPTEDDVTMAQWLQYYRLPYAVIATKKDKVRSSQMQKNRKLIGERLKLKKEDHLFLFSALTRDGKEEVWSYIKEYL